MRGKDNSCFPHCFIYKDHPCVCGEKTGSKGESRGELGSPLRMRGKESSLSLPKSLSRITPAYAGKRTRVSSRTLSVQDHPCVCGEKDADL